jgi:hypothetical protein
MKGINKFHMVVTPFLISPKGEKFDLLLPPWGKVGKGVKANKNNMSFINIYN